MLLCTLIGACMDKVKTMFSFVRFRNILHSLRCYTYMYRSPKKSVFTTNKTKLYHLFCYLWIKALSLDLRKLFQKPVLMNSK